MSRVSRMMLCGLAGLAVMCCVGCSSGGGTLTFDPSNPLGGRTYSLPEQFTDTQGANGWSYYAATLGQLPSQLLEWAPAPAGTPYAITAGWQSHAVPDLLIADGKLHAGTNTDLVIAWRVPSAGKYTVSVALTGLLTDAKSDGVSLSIWLNAAQLITPALIPNLAGQTPITSTMHTMVKDDMVAVRINPRQSAAADWYGYRVEITR